MQKTILVIDDNPDLRENIAEILALAGYNALTAENGKRGVDVALKERPDLIVCDIMMPELDGYGVLHLLRKHGSAQATPFIFLTAKTERSDFRKGMEMGADDYITKPFDDVELLNAVEARLKKAAVLQTEYPSGNEGLQQFLKDVKSSGALQRLSETYATESYPKRHSVYAEGRRPRWLYYVVSGKLKTFRLHEDGKEYITNLYSKGDFVGYASLLNDAAYDDTAVVLEAAELLLIPKEDYLAMVNTDIAIAAKFIGIVSQAVKEKEERLLNLAYGSLRKRVAKGLVEIAAKFGANDNTSIEILREDIAQYVGTATESLIRTLSDFKAEGLIDIERGKVTVKNVAALENLAY